MPAPHLAPIIHCLIPPGSTQRYHWGPKVQAHSLSQFQAECTVLLICHVKAGDSTLLFSWGLTFFFLQYVIYQDQCFKYHNSSAAPITFASEKDSVLWKWVQYVCGRMPNYEIKIANRLSCEKKKKCISLFILCWTPWSQDREKLQGLITPD